MNVEIINNTSEIVPIREMYTSIGANATISTDQFFPGDLEKMEDLQAKKADGTLTVNVTFTDDELASLLVTAPGSVQAAAAAATDDASTTDEAGQASITITVWRSFVAGVPGTADDVVIFSEGDMPAEYGPKYRLIDAMAVVSAAVALSTLTIRNREANAGDQLALLDSASVGLKRATALGAADSSVQTTLDATHGLVIRRSDRGVAGEVMLTLRKEF